jgi:hypothetical protein
MVRSKQQGVTLTGLITALAVIGVVLVFALRMIPAYIEYNAIKSAIVKTKAEGGTVRAMQAAFDRNTGVNDVEAIRGRDLIFTRDDGDLEISFAYEKRLPVAGNVSILIDFAGTTDPSGVVAEVDTATTP